MRAILVLVGSDRCSWQKTPMLHSAVLTDVQIQDKASLSEALRGPDGSFSGMDGTGFGLSMRYYIPYCEVIIKSIIAFVTLNVTL